MTYLRSVTEAEGLVVVAGKRRQALLLTQLQPRRQPDKSSGPRLPGPGRIGSGGPIPTTSPDGVAVIRGNTDLIDVAQPDPLMPTSPALAVRASRASSRISRSFSYCRVIRGLDHQSVGAYRDRRALVPTRPPRNRAADLRLRRTANLKREREVLDLAGQLAGDRRVPALIRLRLLGPNGSQSECRTSTATRTMGAFG